MPEHYTLIKNFVSLLQCEILIKDTFKFKQEFYNEDNLRAHRTYLADERPHRTSHAYAVSHGYIEGFTGILPTIHMESGVEHRYNFLVNTGFRVMLGQLLLNPESRALFNVQEYYGGSEAVPKHMDGELLEFTADAEGNLDIRRTIRPQQVAVLTLVNDTDGGGTRVHLPDGTSEVVRGEAGDLLVFRNDIVYHSVDALKGEVRRPDGLLRMTIGWRSLGDKVSFFQKGTELGQTYPVSLSDANRITEEWYRNEWPGQWEKIQAATQKAAF